MDIWKEGGSLTDCHGSCVVVVLSASSFIRLTTAPACGEVEACWTRQKSISEYLGSQIRPRPLSKFGRSYLNGFYRLQTSGGDEIAPFFSHRWRIAENESHTSDHSLQTMEETLNELLSRRQLVSSSSKVCIVVSAIRTLSCHPDKTHASFTFSNTSSSL